MKVFGCSLTSALCFLITSSSVPALAFQLEPSVEEDRADAPAGTDLFRYQALAAARTSHIDSQRCAGRSEQQVLRQFGKTFGKREDAVTRLLSVRYGDKQTELAGQFIYFGRDCERSANPLRARRGYERALYKLERQLGLR